MFPPPTGWCLLRGFSLNITCVVDNAVRRSSRFWGEHGVAFLIETENERVLFDTGQSGTVLLHNLAILGLEPDDLDALVLSHAHYDHTGGLSLLTEQLNPGTPLYANPDLFRERYAERDGELENVGLTLTRGDLMSRVVLALDRGEQEIVPGVWTTGAIVDRPDMEGRSDRHWMRQAGEIVPDAYLDDMALVLTRDDGLVLLCGCCHAGLLNTLAHVERVFGRSIRVIAGGLHLSSASEDELAHICHVLAGMPVLERLYPNHCTGEAAFVALTCRLGASVVEPCPAGTVLEV